MHQFAISVLLAAGALITAQPLVDSDVLEPSVQNEVEHAIAVASTNYPPVSVSSNAVAKAFGEGGPLATNGLDRTAVAVKLVSLQDGQGRWMSGTNDVTSAVVELLSGFIADSLDLWQ